GGSVGATGPRLFSPSVTNSAPGATKSLELELKSRAGEPARSRRVRVPDSHPTLETLARWLAGRLEHDEVLVEIVPHLLVQCPECRAKYDEIQRLLHEIGHWDEEIAVVESRGAPELLAALAHLPFDEQLRHIAAHEEFHTWGFCHLLLKKSQEAVF